MKLCWQIFPLNILLNVKQCADFPLLPKHVDYHTDIAWNKNVIFDGIVERIHFKFINSTSWWMFP
jgi:hypothetical protein